MPTIAEINHARTFVHECTLLLDYKNMYTSIIDALFNDYTYFLDFKSNLFSNTTLSLYHEFFNSLKDYLESKPYGRNQVFAFIDPHWYEIRVNGLTPFIQSAERDFEHKGVEYVSILNHVDIDNRPASEEIIAEIEKLYDKQKA